jgi:hypothetical protein
MKINFLNGARLINILEKNNLIPEIQLHQIKEGVVLNPSLSITPQNWWVESFDWFFALDILPAFNYGPFFHVYDHKFWPQIGTPADIFSEKNCFYGLQKPKDINEAEQLYDLRISNKKTYIYEFFIKLPKVDYINEPLIFIGPVRNGAGFQINPNKIVSKIIQFAIIDKGIKRYRIDSRGKYSEVPEIYKIIM